MDNRKLGNKLYKYKMLSHSQPPGPGIATMGPQCWKEGYILTQSEPKEPVKTHRI